MTNLSALTELVLEAAIHSAEVPHASSSRRLPPNSLLPPVVCTAVGYTTRMLVRDAEVMYRIHENIVMSMTTPYKS